MKKVLLLMMACALCAWSCTEDGTSDTPSTATSELLSFGFYAEDNEGLEEDYLVDAIESEMVIRVPKGTDKTALVARFTLSDDGVLYYGDVEQVSGTSANDFTYTLDFEVQNTVSELLTQYSIRVGDILDMVWTQYATYVDSYEGTLLEGDKFSMAVSPVDNLPYVFLTRERALTPDESYPDSFSVVVTFDEAGAATATDELTYSEDGAYLFEPTGPEIAVDADGKVYIGFYASYSDSEGTSHAYSVVKTGSGSSWTTVGSTFGSTKPNSYYYGMEIDPATNYPVYGWCANAAAGSIARREWEVCTYNGSSWEYDTTITDLASQTIYWGSYKAINGTLYFGGMSVYGYTYFVYKYENGVWTKVVEDLPDGASTVGSSIGMAFDVASDGTVYLFTSSNDDDGSTWMLKAFKCAPGESEWSTFGSLLADGSSSNVRVSMALYNDLPVVLYRDATTSYPTIAAINSETLDWDDKIVLQDVACGKYGGLHIEFAPDGTGYAAFMDDDTENAPLTIYKFSLEAEVIQ